MKNLQTKLFQTWNEPKLTKITASDFSSRPSTKSIPRVHNTNAGRTMFTKESLVLAYRFLFRAWNLRLPLNSPVASQLASGIPQSLIDSHLGFSISFGSTLRLEIFLLRYLEIFLFYLSLSVLSFFLFMHLFCLVFIVLSFL